MTIIAKVQEVNSDENAMMVSYEDNSTKPVTQLRTMRVPLTEKETTEILGMTMKAFLPYIDGVDLNQKSIKDLDKAIYSGYETYLGDKKSEEARASGSYSFKSIEKTELSVKPVVEELVTKE